MVGGRRRVPLSERADHHLGQDEGTAPHIWAESAAYARGDHEGMVESLEQCGQARGEKAGRETDGGEAKMSIPESREREGREPRQPKRPGEGPGLELNRREDEDLAQAGRPRRPPP